MFEKIRRKGAADRRGAVVVLVAVAGTVIVGFSALTIDVGNMYIVRTELQRSADSAALAAVSKLARYQSGVSESAARIEAEKMTEANPVAGKPTRLDFSKDVKFGHAVWNEATKKYTFQEGGTVPNAVRVSVRKTKDSPNGSLPLFFASFYGADVNMKAQATAMVVPRDISVVADVSGSHSYDSQLMHYKKTMVNLWNVWVCLPIEKGNNGVGNGIDPPPPGLPPLNDGYGTSPGNPGNRGGADPKTDPGLTGPTWGRMATWGTLEIGPGYNPVADPGLLYLPNNASWSGDTSVNGWLAQVGYSNAERTALTRNSSSDWKYRVSVALGLARWDSGKSGGLWEGLPKGKTKNTKGNGDDVVSSGELAWLVDFPYDSGSWLEYIDSYMRDSNTCMAQADASFKFRFGLKTFVNYMLERRRTYAENPDFWKTPQQPMQAVKDAVDYCMDMLGDLESNDQVSFEIYGTTARHVKNLGQSFSQVTDAMKALQAAHYDECTNMGGGIDKAIKELTGTRARANAAKVIFLLTDGQPNIDSYGGFSESGGEKYARDKAKEAAGKGIQFYCVSVGADVNRNLMQEIATIGGGEEFYAVGSIDQYSSQLKQILGELGSKRVARLID